MKLKALLFLIIFIMFTSCFVSRSGIPVETLKPQSNPTYKVEYLFEHDGCKVYRFYDRGNYVYFTNCKGEVTSIASDSVKTRIENRTIEVK
ncbi:MAG: DUF4884 domain-containing protein [Bacteroidales bacterium]|nr:DUF4884 domain-containing protein [Bacteroidales bacterium]